MNKVIGTCSLCGGQVCVPTIYHSVVPPRPQCVRCGAVAKRTGPVIEMEPRRSGFQCTSDGVYDPCCGGLRREMATCKYGVCRHQ